MANKGDRGQNLNSNDEQNREYTIYNSQLYFILVSVMVGVGIISLPSVLARNVGRDGWISTLVGTLLALFFAFLITRLCLIFPNLTLAEFSRIILGKYMGAFLTMVYVIYTITTCAFILRLFIELIKIWYLPRTPVFVLIFLLTFLVIYLSRNGLKIIGRVSLIIFWITIPLIILSILPPLINQSDFFQVRPVGSSGLQKILTGGLQTITSFSGFEVLLLFVAFTKRPKKVYRVAAGSITTTGFLYAFVVFANIAVFGINELIFLNYPFFDYLKMIEIPLISRLELIFIFYWTFAVFITIAIFFFSGVLAFRRLFRLKNQKNAVFWLVPPLVIISLLPDRIIEVEQYLDITTSYGFIYLYILVILLLVVARIRGLKGENNGEK